MFYFEKYVLLVCCLVSPPVFVFSRLFDCVPALILSICVCQLPVLVCLPSLSNCVMSMGFVFMCMFVCFSQCSLFCVLSLTRGVALIVMVSVHVYNLFTLPLDLLLVFPCVIQFFCLS